MLATEPLDPWQRSGSKSAYISQTRGLSRLQLSFSLSQLLIVNGDLRTGLRIDYVQTHCLSRYHSPPQPPVQLSPDTLSPVIQQASNADICVNGKRMHRNLCGLLWSSVSVVCLASVRKVLGSIPSWIPVDFSFSLSNAYIKFVPAYAEPNENSHSVISDNCKLILISRQIRSNYESIRGELKLTFILEPEWTGGPGLWELRRGAHSQEQR